MAAHALDHRNVADAEAEDEAAAVPIVQRNHGPPRGVGIARIDVGDRAADGELAGSSTAGSPPATSIRNRAIRDTTGPNSRSSRRRRPDRRAASRSACPSNTIRPAVQRHGYALPSLRCETRIVTLKCSRRRYGRIESQGYKRGDGDAGRCFLFSRRLRDRHRRARRALSRIAASIRCSCPSTPISRSAARTPFPGGGELPKRYAHTHDPFVGLAFAAAATKKLKVGTGICLVPQHEPIVTAKAIATLDQLSGGRFIFGIGGGWNVDEMENHGARYETRFKQMREHVLAMKALWTEDEALVPRRVRRTSIRSGRGPSRRSGRIRRSSWAARPTIRCGA